MTHSPASRSLASENTNYGWRGSVGAGLAESSIAGSTNEDRMAKKTQAQKGALAKLAKVRKALDEIELTQKRFQKGIVGVRLSQKALKLLRETKAHLVAVESDLQSLLGPQCNPAKGNVRAASQTWARKVLSGRKHVDAGVPTASQRNRRQADVGSRKGLHRKQAGKDHWYPTGDPSDD